MSKEKYINLGKKIKALVDRGIGGEKTSAEAQLQNLMKKYGLTIEDLEEEKSELREFIIEIKFSELFHQVVCSVMDDKASVRRFGKGSKYRYQECTLIEKIEIELKYEFYKLAYLEDLQSFNMAFYVKNNLFRKTRNQAKPSEFKMDEKSLKAMKMMDSIEERKFQKRLNS